MTAAVLAGAGAATADPSVSAKQAQARQVLAQIQQIDASMERAVEAYDAATARLQTTKRELRFNKQALHVARPEAGHGLNVEPGEGATERVALAEDRQP